MCYAGGVPGADAGLYAPVQTRQHARAGARGHRWNLPSSAQCWLLLAPKGCSCALTHAGCLNCVVLARRGWIEELPMRVLRRGAIRRTACSHMASANGECHQGRLRAGLDFASFGADLGAAQAAALQFYGTQGTADTSVGTLLNGVERPPCAPHCNRVVHTAACVWGVHHTAPQVSASFLQQGKPPWLALIARDCCYFCKTC